VNALRAIYRFWMALVVLAVLVQIGAAGYGAFDSANHLKDKGDRYGHEGFEDAWNFHTGLGWLTVYGILLALLFALLARVGRPRIWWQLGLAVAAIAQALFAFLGEDHPATGFLHPLNALVILALSGLLARGAWRPAALAA